MDVDRCVCRGVTFAELIRLARSERLSIDGLIERTGCGESCGLCLPYIRLAVATGRATLPIMSDAECARQEREAAT
ncbi:MAG: (2Fe-2S)-binding protein [Phycisphaerales bacterium]|nr:(2Fe-2S)-binding protein [Phycisphaerales bacterium]